MVSGLVRRDLRVRYAGSFLGIAWTVLQPLLQLLVYVVVFSVILQVKFTAGGGSGNFALYLLVGLLPWMAFQEGVTKAATAVVEHAALVKGSCFPAAVLVASSVLASIINLLAGLAVLLLVLLATGHLWWSGLLFLPLLVCLQTALALGLGLVMASLYTFLRDTLPVLQIGFMIWFYLTPIIYPLAYVPQQLTPLFACNPLTSVVTAYRAALLEGVVPAASDFLLPLAWTVVSVLLGSVMFTRVEPGFADVL